MIARLRDTIDAARCLDRYSDVSFWIDVHAVHAEIGRAGANIDHHHHHVVRLLAVVVQQRPGDAQRLGDTLAHKFILPSFPFAEQPDRLDKAFKRKPLAQIREESIREHLGLTEVLA